LVFKNDAVHQFFLGGCSLETNVLGKSFFGKYTSSRVLSARYLGYDLADALQKADTVILTGGYERPEGWPPLDVISNVYRLFTGIEMDTTRLTPITEFGTLCAYRLSLGKHMVYLTPGDIRLMPMAYRCILRDTCQSKQPARDTDDIKPEPPRQRAEVKQAEVKQAEHTSLLSLTELNSQYSSVSLPRIPVVPQAPAVAPQTVPQPPIAPQVYAAPQVYTEPRAPEPQSFPEPPRSPEPPDIPISRGAEHRAGNTYETKVQEAPARQPAREMPDAEHFEDLDSWSSPKKAKKNKWLYRTVTAIVALAFIFSVAFLTYRALESSTASRQGDSLKNIYGDGTPDSTDNGGGYGDYGGYTEPDTTLNYYSIPETTEAENTAENPPNDSGGRVANTGLNRLKEMNPDIVGWITIPGTQADGPVMQSALDKPDYYLDYDFYRQSGRLGALYIDANNALGITRNVTVYGHQARSGAMFGELKRYLDPAFLKANPEYTFESFSGESKWAVFAAIVVTADNASPDFFEWRVPDFETDAEFTAFVNDVQSRSRISTNVNVAPGDNLMNLVTCSSEFDNARLVIFAKEIP